MPPSGAPSYTPVNEKGEAPFQADLEPSPHRMFVRALAALGLTCLGLWLTACTLPFSMLLPSTVLQAASPLPLLSTMQAPLPTHTATSTAAATASPTQWPTSTETATVSPTPLPGATETATISVSPTYTPTSTLYAPSLPTAPAYLDNSWQTMPVIPEIGGKLRDRLQAIYARGRALGNNPQAFSKVGDCNTASAFFLAPFDTPQAYQLGDYAYLQPLISNFHGSFARVSLAAHTGFGPGAMFDPTWADPAVCGPNEGPLPCEFRVHRPSLVLIGLGTHYPPLAEFESQMRRVIEYSLEQGVIPILATKVDTEGGDRVNALIARLADQYQIPLWKFWRAEQPLWNHGQPDAIHFTWASNDFSSAYSLRYGWPVRNLTALQALDAVWKASISP